MCVQQQHMSMLELLRTERREGESDLGIACWREICHRRRLRTIEAVLRQRAHSAPTKNEEEIMDITENRRYRITVDYEANSEDWWAAAKENLGSAPEALRPLITGCGVSEISVAGEVAAEIVAWSAALPGWDSGHEFEREQLRVEAEVDAEA